MGLYIKNVNLDEWLKEYARAVSPEQWNPYMVVAGYTPICEFRDPQHSLMICWTHDEMQRALPRENDQRPRGYYFAPSEAVRENLGPGMLSAMKQDLAEGLTTGELLFRDLES